MKAVFVFLKKISEMKRVKFDLELTHRLDSILISIAAQKSIEKAEVLRFAIDYLDVCMKAKKDGMIIGAWSQCPECNHLRERIFITE